MLARVAGLRFAKIQREIFSKVGSVTSTARPTYLCNAHKSINMEEEPKNTRGTIGN